MTQLHDYEAWLDTVDARFQLEEHSIELKFDKTHTFPLSSLNNISNILEQSEILKLLAFSNAEGLPLEYMCRRLVRLSNLKNSASVDIEHVIKELKQKWGSFYENPK